MKNTLDRFKEGIATMWNGGGLFASTNYYPPNMPKKFWLEAIGVGPQRSTTNAADESIGPEICEAIPAYYSCINVGSQDMMKVPLLTYDPIENNGKKKVQSNEDPIAWALEVQSNPLMSAVIFRKVMMANVLPWGQAFAEIVVNPLDGSYALYPIHPSRVMPRYNENTGIFQDWEIMIDDKSKEQSSVFIPEEKMFRIIGYTHDGINGISPAQVMADSLGGAKAAEITAAALFGNGCNIRGVFEHPGNLSDKALEHLRTSLNDVYTGGRNAYKAMILEEDMKFKGITMPMRDAQLLESRQFSSKQICQSFRISPVKIFDHEQSGYNSRESDHQTHKDDFILPWAITWEAEIKRKLYPDSNRFVLFDMDALQRGNRLERYQGHKIATEGGWKTTNEIRLEEGDNPKDEHGDEYLVTVQGKSESHLHEMNRIDVEIRELERQILEKQLEGMDKPEPEPEPEEPEEPKEGEDSSQDAAEGKISDTEATLAQIVDRDISRWINRENKAVSRHLDGFEDWYESFYTEKELVMWIKDIAYSVESIKALEMEEYFQASIQAIMESGEHDPEFHKNMLKKILGVNHD